MGASLSVVTGRSPLFSARCLHTSLSKCNLGVIECLEACALLRSCLPLRRGTAVGFHILAISVQSACKGFAAMLA